MTKRVHRLVLQILAIFACGASVNESLDHEKYYYALGFGVLAMFNAYIMVAKWEEDIMVAKWEEDDA